jgi:3-mercaptopyruvate sulfurtransferase SseA
VLFVLQGSFFFDIDEISDKSSKLPHMLPTTEEFENRVGGYFDCC